MAEVLRSPSHFPSSPRRPLSCDPNDGSNGLLSPCSRIEECEEEEERRNGGGCCEIEGKSGRRKSCGGGGGTDGEGEDDDDDDEQQQQQQLSVLALFLTLFRKSLLGCKTEGAGGEDFDSMQIGWPTEVRHVAHVTFDRFHGFLGLPVEFEPEVPRRAPSASATVFGVSTESMQCSYDARGNSVPTILLLMQRRLYQQRGLQAEGIFRINAENSQEEYVRNQLNNGVVPERVDVHCLAGLIKAWFRELPAGLLDSLSSEQVMQCQTEEDCARLASLLPPTEAALLDWAINLMVDVVQEEQINKMNARNIATVFAPNMTQMADPLIALMHAVQVMNFLRMLILKTLKERLVPTFDDASLSNADSSDENGDTGPKLLHHESCRKEATGPVIDDPALFDKIPEDEASNASILSLNMTSLDGSCCEQESSSVDGSGIVHANSHRKKANRILSHSRRKGRKARGQSIGRASWPTEKSKGTSAIVVSCMNSKVERIEAWR